MATSVVREAQKPLRARYAADPADATKQYLLKSEPRDPKDPFRAVVKSQLGAGAGATYEVVIDPKLGGPGGGPTPGDVFLAALASCQEATLRMIADSMGIELTAIDVEVSGEVDVRGALLLSKDVPAGFRSIACKTRIAVKPGTPPELTAKLGQLAEQCCVIMSTLRACPPVATSFSVDGG